MNIKTGKAGRRIRLIATVLGGAMALPGLAVANHTTCTEGRDQAQPPKPTDCPEFSADLLALVERPVIDSTSAISYRYGQADHESAAVRLKYYIPTGWQFAVNSLKPGQNSAGLPAATCSDMYDSSSPRNLVRGEALAHAVGMQVSVDSGTSRVIASYGNDPAAGSRKPNISFMRWNPGTQTADLCLYLFTDSTAVGAGGREFLLPVTLTHLSTGAWTMDLDLDSVMRNSVLRPLQASVRDFLIGINGLSGGNWNRNPVTGNLERIAFSRAPADPVNSDLRVDWTVCRDGLNPAAFPAPPACNNGNEIMFTGIRNVNITLPPDVIGYSHDFGKLKGPAGLPTTVSPPTAVFSNNRRDGFGFVRGTTTAPTSWSQPSLGPLDTVKGYVLVVAEPGDQDSRHFDYLVTQQFLVDSNNDATTTPTPGFDATVCGANGKGALCKFDLKFPMSGPGGTILTGDGKYDIALITIYADGHRTDGRCDNGTALGAVCDPNTPGFSVSGTGISSWQFLMRTKAWPNAFGENVNYVVSNVTYTVPRFTLLVDYARKEGEFFIWGSNLSAPVTSALANVRVFNTIGNPADGKGQSFSGSSAGVLGDGGQGVISFGNFKPDGSASSFRFDGVTNPNGACVTTVAVRQACGVFTLWSPNNWTLGSLPSSIDPNWRPNGCVTGTCSPSATSEVFEGARIV